MSQPDASAPLLRIAPALAGLLAFGAAAALYLGAPQAYLVLLAGVGVDPGPHPFIDGEFMYVMKRAWLHGQNIYEAVPEDVIPGNRMAYSPLWPRLPFLSADKAVTIPVALVTNALLLLSFALLPAARTRRDAALLSLAALSSMVVFALERNNIDVWIYLIIAGAAFFAVRLGVSRLVTYALFTFAGLLKYYPFVLLALALRERPRYALIILLFNAAAIAIFAFLFRDEIALQLHAIPGAWSFGSMVGIPNLPKAVTGRLSDWLGPAAVKGASIQPVLRLLLTIAVLAAAIRLARRTALPAHIARMDEHAKVWLLIGCLLMGGCYMAGQNGGYRGIFLMPVLAGLLALRRMHPEPALARTLALRPAIIVALMWAEALRGGANMVAAHVLLLPGKLVAGVGVLVWLARELLWLDIEVVMVAAILAFLVRTPAATLLGPRAAIA